MAWQEIFEAFHKFKETKNYEEFRGLGFDLIIDGISNFTKDFKKSEEEKKYRKTLIEYIETLSPDEKFDLDADDGTFLIDYDNWKNNFTQLFLNIDFPEKWTGVRF